MVEVQNPAPAHCASLPAQNGSEPLPSTAPKTQNSALANSAPSQSGSALDKLDPEARAEYWASLALRHTKGLGVRSICRLVQHFGSAFTALHQVSAWQDAGLSPRKGEALSGQQWRRDARPEWEDARDLDGDILLWTDSRYPACLRELPDAPLLLYTRGDMSLLDNACVGVVGARSCTAEGRNVTYQISRELSHCGVTVVSGLARGIDAIAHSAALHGSGRTIAVMGSGLDVLYPPQNHDLYEAIGKYGLLISEFAPGTRPDTSLFPVRNRIISGLSLGVLVVEAALRSGSLITARLALEQNRTVFAVPGPTSANSSAGCRELIRQGAKSAFAAADILADLLPQLQGVLERFQKEELANAPAHETGTNETKPHASAHAPQPLPTKHSKDAVQIVARAGRGQNPPPKLPSPKKTHNYQPHSLEANLLELLSTKGQSHPDTLLTWLLELPCGAHLEAASLSAQLVLLEVQGLVRRLPGMFYEVV